ncbi:MAG TPA: WG repeat-containing protein [Crocinitomix sp.]|nr:WG repeat-containing protein [Crocinitomix sp.]
MKLLTIILFLFLSYVAQTQSLIPYRKGDKWGYANLSLEVVLKPKYDEVGFFIDKICWVRKNKKYAFIDNTGKFLTPFKYDNIKRCSAAVFSVNIKDSSYCVDSNLKKVRCGHRVAGCGTYDKTICIHFTHTQEDGKIGYVMDYYDFRGLTYDTLPAIWTNFISNEVCLFAVRNDSLWGFCKRRNSTLYMIIDYQYDDVKKQFHSDFYTIIKDNKYGFVNKDGSVIVSPKYVKLNDFIDYCVTVAHITDSFYFYIDVKGNEYYEMNFRMKLKQWFKRNK